MRTKQLLPGVALLLLSVLGGCSKSFDSDSSSSSANGTISTHDASAGTTTGPAQAAVYLGMAGNFAILSKSGITDVYKSSVTGDIGTSPITGAAIHLTCAEVAGTIYAVDAAVPAPCSVTAPSMLTTAVGDMQNAYLDAAGRVNPDFVNLGAGTIGGNVLVPGLYKWTSPVLISSDIILSGSSTDVWIFQVSGTLIMSSGVQITLAGGALAKNIYWQVADAVSLGTTSHFEGNILGMANVSLKTGATINGRLLSQTAVTLEMNTVVQPQ